MCFLSDFKCHKLDNAGWWRWDRKKWRGTVKGHEPHLIWNGLLKPSAVSVCQLQYKPTTSPSYHHRQNSHSMPLYGSGQYQLRVKLPRWCGLSNRCVDVSIYFGLFLWVAFPRWLHESLSRNKIILISGFSTYSSVCRREVISREVQRLSAAAMPGSKWCCRTLHGPHSLRSARGCWTDSLSDNFLSNCCKPFLA